MTLRKSLTVLITAIVAIVVIALVAAPSLSRCVAEGTLVETPNGPRPIETLQAGDAVLSVTPEGRVAEARVVAVRRSVATGWRHLSFGGNRSLEVTGTHPVGVPAGWRPAGVLRAGDEVRTADGLVRLLATEARFGLVVVYDLSVEPHENLIVSGVVVHNKSSSNDAAAIGDSRAVINAEMAYADSNNGAFGQLTCLATPTNCGWPAGTQPFLHPWLASLTTKQGYVRSFIAGRAGKGNPDLGIESFVYIATPMRVGQTGIRGFAVDHTGQLCFTTDGSVPPIVNAALSRSCTPLK